MVSLVEPLLFQKSYTRRKQPLRAATSAEITLGNCSSLIRTRPIQLRLGNVRTTCGSRVRRSPLYIFLNDGDETTSAGKNITENITQKGPSNLANSLNFGSPTRALTWDLRINSPSGASVISLHHQLLTASAHVRRCSRMQCNAGVRKTALLRFCIQVTITNACDLPVLRKVPSKRRTSFH